MSNLTLIDKSPTMADPYAEAALKLAKEHDELHEAITKLLQTLRHDQVPKGLAISALTRLVSILLTLPDK